MEEEILKPKRKRTIKPAAVKKIDKQPVFPAAEIDIESFVVDQEIGFLNNLENVLQNASKDDNLSAVKEIKQKLDATLDNLLDEQKSLKVNLNNSGSKINIFKSYKGGKSAYQVDLRKNPFFAKDYGLTADKAMLPPHLAKVNFKNKIEAPVLLKQGSFALAWDEFKYKLVKFFVKAQKQIKQEEIIIESSPWWLKIKSTLTFALIALLFIIPFEGYKFYNQARLSQGQVLGIAAEAIQDINQGVNDAKNADWAGASQSFSQSVGYFNQAKSYLEQYNQTLINLENVPLVGGKISDGKSLIEAGTLFAQAASDLTAVVAELNQSGGLDSVLGQSLVSISPKLNNSINDLEKALNILNSVSPSSLPQNYRDGFEVIQKQSPALLARLKNTQAWINFALDFLGFNSPKRYLFVFQNKAERRGTGGFMGSYAEIDYSKGKIVSMKVPGGGLYDLKQAFMSSNNKISTPAPMHLLGSAWMPWDANWSPNFPTSMEKLLWFYYHSGGPTVDGVMAFNDNFMAELLKVTGNIVLSDYDNELITPDNLSIVLQHKVEFDYDKQANQPKKIIGDLMAAFLNKFNSIASAQLVILADTVSNSLISKDVQMYFTDETLQNQAKAFGWTGELKEAPKDYLEVVNTNIAGGKTDAYVAQSISHFVEAKPDGNLVATVSINRKHAGDAIDPKSADYVFAHARNISYLRIYVPQGSQFLGATGYVAPDQSLFKPDYEGYYVDEALAKTETNKSIDESTKTDIYNESGKTVFANWLVLDPGQEGTVTFSYLLPFKLSFPITPWESLLNKIGFNTSSARDNYSLLVQNQSGSNNTLFTSVLSLPKNFQVIWSASANGGNLTGNGQNLRFSANLSHDYSYAVLVGN